jgi:osmotically-inducible protein OsmY
MYAIRFITPDESARRQRWRRMCFARVVCALIGGAPLAQAQSTASSPNTLPPHNLAAGDPSYGGEASDTIITAHAKAALLEAPGIDSGDVHVTTRRGSVTLTGTVPNEAQRAQAASVVLDLTGVVFVANQLKVGGSHP